MQYSILLSALYATAALAIMVTEPTNTSTWKDNDSNTITWSSVSTDPTSLDILLVNQAVSPPTSQTLATNVPTSAGSYTVTSLTGVGAGYQINLVSAVSGNSAILAQSNQFTLAAGGGSSSSSSSSSASSMTSSMPASSMSASTLASGSSMTTAAVIGSGISVASSATATGSMKTSATKTASVSGAAGVATGSASGVSASATAASAAGVNAVSGLGLAVAGLVALFA